MVVKNETDTVNPDFAGYDDWFLTPDSSSGTNGNTINPNGTVPGSAYNAAFVLWRDDDTLLKRLGELRYAQEDQVSGHVSSISGWKEMESMHSMATTRPYR